MSAPRVLICYSNPADTSRLRLDIEHAQLEALVRGDSTQPSSMVRLHATRIEDLFQEAANGGYEIIQFSGHGDAAGIYCEAPDRSGAQLVDAAAITKLLRLASPHLRALILTCCYSAEYQDQLAPYVPYVITVEGPAPDIAAIEFAKKFYSYYLTRRESIEEATALAQAVSDVNNTGLIIKVLRRGLFAREDTKQIEIFVGNGRRLLLDITNIRPFLLSLPEELRENFLKCLCTGIRNHTSLFDTAMERVALTFGAYLGIFSWRNSIDPILCDKVLRVSEAISEENFEALTRLMSRYTSLARFDYRTARQRDYPNKPHVVTSGLRGFHEMADKFLGLELGDCLRAIAPQATKISAAIIRANLAEADDCLRREDYSQIVIHLETALTTMHNLILQLLDSVEDKRPA